MPVGPSISNSPAVNIVATNASLVGYLSSTGTAPTEVTVYWGPTNAGTSKAGWATNAYLGTNNVGFLTNTVYTLSASTRYYFSFYASNSVNGAWASPAVLFSTLGPPVVNNGGGATNTSGTSWMLQGEVTGGSPTPDAYIYWGSTDGVTDKSAWTNVVPVGPTNGPFSTVVAVSFGSTNYYRSYASNSVGQAAWASSSVAFTSPVAPFVAQTQYWDIAASPGIQGGHGTWSTTDVNWSQSATGTVLTSWSVGGDHAWFVTPSNGAASVVTVASRINVGSVSIKGSPYTLVVTNGGQMLAGSAASLIGSLSTNNTLIVAGGAGVTSRWEVGTGATNQDLSIGSGANADNNLLLIDGAGVPGSALVTNVAILYVPTSYNSAGRYLNRVVVTNGGWFGNNSFAYIGSGPGNYGSSNSVTVTGSGSKWTTFYLYVGTQAKFNSMMIAKGGQVVMSDAATIGHGAGASSNSVTVTGTGSVWQVNSSQASILMISDNADAVGNSLTISNGGRVVASAGIQIGYGPGNSLLVTGPGSVLTNSGAVMKIGIAGGGTGNTVIVTQGGAVDNVGALTVYSNNYLGLYGGTLGVANATYNGGLFTVGDGTQTATLKAQGGTLGFPSGLVIATNATLTGPGVIVATTTVYGAVSPGVVIGAIVNNGDLTLKSSATTKIELAANTTPGAGWDLLTVTNGSLQLGGALSVVLTGGFTPTNTQAFVIMTNPSPLSVSGSFGNMPFGTVPAYTNAGGRAVGFFRVAIGTQSVVLDSYALVKASPGTIIVVR